VDCNGICAFCNVQCFRGELSKNVTNCNKKEIVAESETVECNTNEIQCNTDEVQEDTGLVVVEPSEVYTIKKTLFGKEKVVRIK
jgi:hypothetical protein